MFTETEIWRQLKNGDPQSLTGLYRAYYVNMVNFGVKTTGNRELTTDCITQVLIKLWDKRAALPDVTNIRAYLLTCLKNELLAELKNTDKIRSGNRQFIQESPLAEISYEEYLIQAQVDLDVKDELKRALSHLTKRETQLLQMKFFEDLSYEEIASRCHISKRTAYNIIHECLPVHQ
jgi:RNA polymerase sigma-70 factor (ECF subfamily)